MNVQNKEVERRTTVWSKRVRFLYLGTDACNWNCKFLNYYNYRKVSFCRDYWMMGGETGGLNYGIVE